VRTRTEMALILTSSPP